MLRWIIHNSLRHRGIVIGAALLTIWGGWWVGRDLRIDVLPDLTKPTVTLLIEAPGLAPEEVESWITLPLEGTLMGTSGLTRLRTVSDVSLSLVFVEFEWGTDIYRARQLVQERLEMVSSDLPPGIRTYLIPIASLMGEIVLIGMHSASGEISARDLRTVADWTVRRRLQGIPGVAEVLAMGGGVKQVQIQPDPQRMRALGVSFSELRHAAEEVASSTTGGFFTASPQEIMVRNLAMTVELDEIGATVVKQESDRSITVGDVADVVWEIEPMRGDAAVNGIPGVILSVTKAPGFDTIRLTDLVERKLAELQTVLPEDVELTMLFQQADFIRLAIDNLKEVIRDGGLMVVVILILFLMSLRSAGITLLAIPLSFAITFLVFSVMGIGVNAMTLGGLSVTIGMVVDDAIVDVENVNRRLRESLVREARRSGEYLHELSLGKRYSWDYPSLFTRRETIANASIEVRNSIFYATLFIIMAFLPLLGLQGVAGRLFTPIAIATIVSMGASFLISLTVIPVLCSLILHPKVRSSIHDGWLIRLVKGIVKRTWLRLALDAPLALLCGVGALLAFAVSLWPVMGKDFLPKFREETVLVAMTAAPGTSLRQTGELADIVDRLLLTIPEVKLTGRRLGRAERGDHVVPVSTVEFDVQLHENGRPRQEILDEMRSKLRTIPGTFSALSGPLADRIGHTISGVSAQIAIKIFGPELDELQRLGQKIQSVAREIPGLEQARIEQQAPISQLRIEMDRQRAQAYGVTAGSLNRQLSSLIGGETVGLLYQGPRTIDLVLRLPRAWRESPERLSETYIDTVGGDQIPLRLIADLRWAAGPNLILRENMERRFVVSINPTSGDLDSLVERLREQLSRNLVLPEGYRISFEGEYLERKTTNRRIMILSALVLALMALLLYRYFGSALFTVQVLCDIPLALVGGLILTKLLIGTISSASLIGMIAVAGIAVRNSVMMLSHFLHLMRHEDEKFNREMVERGSLERLIPVMLTALSAGFALIPLVLAADAPGKELLHPVAVVIVGGLFSSTLLGLGVTPAVFYLFGKKAAERAVTRGALATA